MYGVDAEGSIWIFYTIVVKKKSDLCIKSGLLVPGKGNERISNENFPMVCTDS